MNVLRNLTIVTTHFGDLRWVILLARRVRENTEVGRIRAFVIIDNDHERDVVITEREKFAEVYSILTGTDVKVVSFENSQRHVDAYGHDHPNVLNLIVRSGLEGDWILILDSDCLPWTNDWVARNERILQEGYGAILVDDPFNPGRPHPCFILLPNIREIKTLRFDTFLTDGKTDTGRDIDKQLTEMGVKIRLVPYRRHFLGRYGCLYNNGIYHHTNGSFAEASDSRLLSQVRWRDEFFKELVLKGSVSMQLGDYIRYGGEILRRKGPVATMRRVLRRMTRLWARCI